MTARSHALFVAPLALVLSGCADAPAQRDHHPSPGSYQLLVSAGEWSEVPRETDPFVSESEQAPACVGPGFFVENEWVEVDTGLCTWVTLEARARFDVARGQWLRLVVSHYDLSASAPGEGVLRLQLGACDVWQKAVSIPNPAAVYDEELESPCAVEAGGTLVFHLHNHGQNTWQLQELAVLR